MIKGMTDRELDLLTYDIRGFLISHVAETGGHLASNLGVVELTVALHKAFDVCRDRIIWDVGHQSYIHKILTGRAPEFSTLRRYGGISGFPKTNEHESDVYNSGHSSSSISAAMGLAESRALTGADYHVAAVIGDGALTGGLAYEGLNNVGNRQTKLIVILNDNEMSISKNTGSVAQHLSRLRASQGYQQTKHLVKESMQRIPKVGDRMVHSAERLKEIMRHAVVPGSLFEALGFTYFGPVDGHNIRELVDLFEAVKQLDGPVLLHVVTKKGKGYRNAEKNPGRFHGIGPFDVETGKELVSPGRTWSKAAGGALLDMAGDERIVAISAAMTEPVGLSSFAAAYPDRFYDVGIAEAHAVTFAAGLAMGGLRPFVYIYSTFLQRAYDQIMMDVCAQNLPVVFMIDRAGCVGNDGETHHGVFDLSYLSHIPNLVVMAPKDEDELIRMMKSAVTYDRPTAIRYPRGRVCRLPKEYSVTSSATSGVTSIATSGDFSPIEIGRSERLLTGHDVELRAVGKMVEIAVEAAEILGKLGISCGLVNERFVTPPDAASIILTGQRNIPIVTMEDNVAKGGFGETVTVLLTEQGCPVRVLPIAWPDEFVPQGGVDELMHTYGLDVAQVTLRVTELLRHYQSEERMKSLLKKIGESPQGED
ncbi:MAG: 1-deoxy-D-xylulose-5-phosphate synthase [Clostridiales Family XIII bacterium]|jgi:1-deoxy-D-xylulose-5-phosphate synthase|nr:1-deoxy-D-xylulose-5-phosphate synthase [Clostridiales Family XIII bacterium]